MTSHPRPFRLSATLLTGPAGVRPLPLVGEFTTDSSRPPLVLEWTEFDRVRLRLESADQDGILEVEGYNTPIGSGSERTVPDPQERELDAYPWYPGDYELRVVVEGENWYGLFRVKPRHLEVDQLAHLRQDLERVVAGLSLDVGLHRGYQGRRSYTYEAGAVDGVRLRQLGLLREALNEVASAMVRIEREPHRRLGRAYDVVPWHQSQRLDGKSFRWLAQGEWLREPKALPAPGLSRTPRAVLAPSARQSFDTYENRVAAFILDTLLVRTRTLSKALESDLGGLGTELERAHRNGWETGPLQEKVAGYRQLQPLVAEVEERLWHWRSRPFLAEVGALEGMPIPTTTTLKDSRYRVLYRWYRRVEEALVDVDTGEQFQMRTKRTSTLYEYWCLFRVLELFGELGFRLTDGGLGLKLRESNRNRLIPVIEPGTVFWLESDRGVRLRVVYDQALPTTQDEARELGFDLYIANPKNRPDIRVDLFEGDQPVRCLVLDAKYRRLSAIWNRAHPEGVYQLLSYSGNLYHVARPRQSMTQVAVALYPGSGGDADWQTRESGGIALARMVPNRPASELKACFRRFVGDQHGT